MSHFSSALAIAIDSPAVSTQRELAEAAGMSAPQLSRYARGRGIPPLPAVAGILRALPPEHRAPVLIGFLKDQTPEEFASLVSIAPASGHVQTSAAPSLPVMDSEVRKMVELFASLGMRHSEVRDMMRSYLRMVVPNQAP